MQYVRQLSTSIDKPLKLNYLLYLPPEYEAATDTKWPLIMFLHGLGERGDEPNHVERLNLHGLPKILDTRTDFPFIVVSPQCPGTSWWPLQLDALNALLDDIIATHAVDVSRVYLTGLSMGGFGTWSLAISYPHRFAAIAPICGGGVPALAETLKEVPVWAFHGALDEIVPLAASESMVRALRASGGDVRFTVYPDLQHDSWTVTYDNPDLYDWFLEHQLN